MNSTPTLQDFHKQKDTPEARERRNIAREEALAWDEAARELGFTPEERQVAWERWIREEDPDEEEGQDE